MEYTKRQSGLVKRFVVVAIILSVVAVAALYGLHYYGSSQRDASIANETTKVPAKPEQKPDGRPLRPHERQVLQDNNKKEQTPEQKGGTNGQQQPQPQPTTPGTPRQSTPDASQQDLPQTGPAADALMLSVALGSVIGVVTAYRRSARVI